MAYLVQNSCFKVVFKLFWCRFSIVGAGRRVRHKVPRELVIKFPLFWTYYTPSLREFPLILDILHAQPKGDPLVFQHTCPAPVPSLAVYSGTPMTGPHPARPAPAALQPTARRIVRAAVAQTSCDVGENSCTILVFSISRHTRLNVNVADLVQNSCF